MRRSGLVSLHDALLVLWIVLLGADRVSLLDTVVPFTFTPFLALTPFVVASEWLRHSARGRRTGVPGPAIGYAAVCAALVAVVLASISMSTEPSTSAMRAVLLVANISGTFAITILASDREDLAGLLARAAVVGIAMYAVFDIVQLAALFRLVPGTLSFGPVAVHLESNPYAGVIPRLSGPVGDPNRTGLVLLFMAFLTATGERQTTIRRGAIALAGVLMFFTLSRSTLLAVVATLLVVAATSRPRRGRVRSIVACCVAIAALSAVVLVAPPSLAPQLEPVAPLAERFTVTESSTSEHLLLLRRGIGEATSSVPRLLLGLGYGNAYVVLQDRFPGNRYGNFHSLYVSMFAEAGVFALLLVLVLLGGPLLAGGPYRPLIAGAAVFSVFYQATAEPAFWLALALAWSFMRPAPPVVEIHEPRSA